MSATFYGMLCASNTQGNNVHCSESPLQEQIVFMDAFWQVEACMPTLKYPLLCQVSSTKTNMGCMPCGNVSKWLWIE